MNKGNPKKNPDARRERPTYKSSGTKRLHVELMHMGVATWVKVEHIEGKTITGIILDKEASDDVVIGSEITFDEAEITSAEEVDFIVRSAK